MTKEVWRDIPGYKGYYQASDLGRVRSLPRYGTRGKVLKPVLTTNGYLRVGFNVKGKCKKLLVHRIIAQTFIDNPKNLPQVNHKNEHKTDNRVSNLEWLTAKENSNYGTGRARANLAESKPVLQISLDGRLIRRWPSAQCAGRNGYNQGNICSCCNGKRKTTGGFRWEFEKENDTEC